MPNSTPSQASCSDFSPTAIKDASSQSTQSIGWGFVVQPSWPGTSLEMSGIPRVPQVGTLKDAVVYQSAGVLNSILVFQTIKPSINQSIDLFMYLGYLSISLFFSLSTYLPAYLPISLSTYTRMFLFSIVLAPHFTTVDAARICPTWRSRAVPSGPLEGLGSFLPKAERIHLNYSEHYG